MQTQGNLFSKHKDTTTRQPGLFDQDGPEVSDLACASCGELLVRTQSGYLACPRGHGRLISETDEPCGSWFDRDE